MCACIPGEGGRLRVESIDGKISIANKEEQTLNALVVEVHSSALLGRDLIWTVDLVLSVPLCRCRRVYCIFLEGVTTPKISKDPIPSTMLLDWWCSAKS